MHEQSAVPEPLHQGGGDNRADHRTDAIRKQQRTGNHNRLVAAETVHHMRHGEGIDHRNDNTEQKAENIQQFHALGPDARQSQFHQHRHHRHHDNYAAPVDQIGNPPQRIGAGRATQNHHRHKGCHRARAQTQMFDIGRSQRPETAIGHPDQPDGDQPDRRQLMDAAENQFAFGRQRRRLDLADRHRQQSRHQKARRNTEQLELARIENPQELLARRRACEMDDIIEAEHAAAVILSGFIGDPAFDNAIEPAEGETAHPAQRHPQPDIVDKRKAQSGNRHHRGIGRKRPDMADPAHNHRRHPGSGNHADKIGRTDPADVAMRKSLDRRAQRHQRRQQAIADDQKENGRKHRHKKHDQG